MVSLLSCYVERNVHFRKRFEAFLGRDFLSLRETLYPRWIIQTAFSFFSSVKLSTHRSKGFEQYTDFQRDENETALKNETRRPIAINRERANS